MTELQNTSTDKWKHIASAKGYSCGVGQGDTNVTSTET